MRTHVIGALVMGLCLGAAGLVHAQTTQPPPPVAGPAETEALKTLQAKAYFMHELAMLAREKSQSPEIKLYAQQLQEASKALQKDVKELANRVMITLPDTPDMPGQYEQAAIADLQQAQQGQDFDRKFLRALAVASEMAIVDIESDKMGLRNKDVRFLANTTIAGIKLHRNSAEKLLRLPPVFTPPPGQ